MIQFIDTHSHLYSNRFQADLEEVLQRTEANCSHVLLPNIDLESIQPMHELCERSSVFYPMMGLHPCHVGANWKEVNAQLRKAFEEKTYFGVGETGLDYYWDKTFIQEQKESLRMHIEWAKELDLPLILHCRESMDDVIELVRLGQNGSLKGIFHCFNGDQTQSQKIQDLGFHMGLGGVITYKKNDDLRSVVRDIPMEKIVLETDSPYLPPVPYRGKRNESSYVKLVGEKVAEIKGLEVAAVAQQTSQNAKALFNI